MRKVLIIEDEKPAAERLISLLSKQEEKYKVVGVKDSVSSSVEFLRNQSVVDLILMDIQLADGLSFTIFSRVKLTVPVIFTTAFDQYALKAFKVNSIDYLLKPVDEEELTFALNKYQRMVLNHPVINHETLRSLELALSGRSYKERFLSKNGKLLSYVDCAAIAYFYAEDGLIFARCYDGSRHVIDYAIDELVNLLDPKLFFRINRQMMLNVNAIQNIQTYFNSRLVLRLNPDFSDQVIVSRQRVGDFKEWLDQ